MNFLGSLYDFLMSLLLEYSWPGATPNLWDPPVDAWSGKERRHPMLVHCDRLLGTSFHDAGFSLSIIGVLSCTRFRLSHLWRKTVLVLRDLELFAALCLARFIVWRNGRERN